MFDSYHTEIRSGVVACPPRAAALARFMPSIRREARIVARLLPPHCAIADSSDVLQAGTLGALEAIDEAAATGVTPTPDDVLMHAGREMRAIAGRARAAVDWRRTWH
jgi:hypothetical protein